MGRTEPQTATLHIHGLSSIDTSIHCVDTGENVDVKVEEDSDWMRVQSLTITVLLQFNHHHLSHLWIETVLRELEKDLTQWAKENSHTV